MRTTAFRVSRRPAGRGRLRPTALPIAVVTVFAALFGAAAPAAALDPAPASAPGQTVPTTAPGCVHLYAGLRYTHLHSECEEEHLLRVRYTFGEVSDCRLVVPGGWHTFRGYGFDGDHPVAVEPCAD
ncbi:alpha-amylase [Streptomyces alkaliphilus]|nr:alpha-amylase [Streptomyces alkaliphilus]